MSINLARLVRWASSMIGSESRTKESPRSQHAIAVRPWKPWDIEAYEKNYEEAKSRVDGEFICSL